MEDNTSISDFAVLIPPTSLPAAFFSVPSLLRFTISIFLIVTSRDIPVELAASDLEDRLVEYWNADFLVYINTVLDVLRIDAKSLDYN